MSELKDCSPLKYYDFKPVDHVRLCPRYTAVLGRSEDDGIGSGELDTLQLELETLLSSASRRLRALEEQRQVGGRSSIQQQMDATFDLPHRFHPSRSSQIGKTKRETSASLKWEKTLILQPHPATSPRNKNWMGKEHMDKDLVPEGPNPKTCSRKFKSMNLQMNHKISRAPPKMMLPTGQHEALFTPYLSFSASTLLHCLVYLFWWIKTLFMFNLFTFYFFFSRFWASVEPYCADITNEEIRLLEELLKPLEDEAEYFKVWF